MTRIALPAADFAATFDAVRFAVATDPTLPALVSVLLEADPNVLRLVATDRYRLAVAEAPADVDGPPVRLVLPLDFVDEVHARLAGPPPTGTLTLDVTTTSLRADHAGRAVTGTPAGTDFPDYRRLVRPDGSADVRRLTVDAAALRHLLATEPAIERHDEGLSYLVTILGAGPAGGVRVASEQEWAADPPAHVAVNREFLVQAVNAAGAGQLMLELDGPIRPLAIRVPDDDTRFSILMPVRH